MLSETNTIPDVLERLENVYSYYGYSNDDEFENALETIAYDVKLIVMYPKLGSTEYARIAALDKVGLSETEEYLYWAEVYSICYEFLKLRLRITGQLQTSADESLRVEGYEYKTGASSTISPNDLALNGYKDKMIAFFKSAGYDLMALQRTCTIFGIQPAPEDIINIIE